MSLADIAIAVQLSLLRFPKSSGEPLWQAKDILVLAINLSFKFWFNWRDRIETTLMESNLGQSPKQTVMTRIESNSIY